MKRRILIGSLSSPNFAIRTTKMDCLGINFGELLFQIVAQKRFLVNRIFLPSCLKDNFI